MPGSRRPQEGPSWPTVLALLLTVVGSVLVSTSMVVAVPGAAELGSVLFLAGLLLATGAAFWWARAQGTSVPGSIGRLLRLAGRWLRHLMP